MDTPDDDPVLDVLRRKLANRRRKLDLARGANADTYGSVSEDEIADLEFEVLECEEAALRREDERRRAEEEDK